VSTLRGQGQVTRLWRCVQLHVLTDLNGLNDGELVSDSVGGQLAAEDHSDLCDLWHLFLDPRPIILQWPFVADSVSG
jgi:hypothetical protein